MFIETILSSSQVFNGGGWFENSAVRLPSAKEDMFNGRGWFGLDAITRFYRVDLYSCLFRQYGSVKTQGECSSGGSRVKEGYAYGCSSFQEDIGIQNVAFSSLSCEAGSLLFWLDKRKIRLRLAMLYVKKTNKCNSMLRGDIRTRSVENETVAIFNLYILFKFW
ncbi:hypothetical protein Tco_0876690 [Tanacetum coccineum]|uniref:Uncharacterized protein n=1 Tax=Tanacetum coccineum TaxID=301880 RepID=A0ABQ5BY93_9ASTR